MIPIHGACVAPGCRGVKGRTPKRESPRGDSPGRGHTQIMGRGHQPFGVWLAHIAHCQLPESWAVCRCRSPAGQCNCDCIAQESGGVDQSQEHGLPGHWQLRDFPVDGGTLGKQSVAANQRQQGHCTRTGSCFACGLAWRVGGLTTKLS